MLARQFCMTLNSLKSIKIQNANFWNMVHLHKCIFAAIIHNNTREAMSVNALNF